MSHDRDKDNHDSTAIAAATSRRIPGKHSINAEFAAGFGREGSSIIVVPTSYQIARLDPWLQGSRPGPPTPRYRCAESSPTARSFESVSVFFIAGVGNGQRARAAAGSMVTSRQGDSLCFYLLAVEFRHRRVVAYYCMLNPS